VGALYVSSNVHSGWRHVARDGRIKLVDDNIGGHAFALVAYDERGFWLQNSWGNRWGHEGFARVDYEDWLKNGTDAWAARLAVPVELPTRASTTRQVFAGTIRAKAYSYTDLRTHVISLGNDGLLDPQGNIGTTPELVQEIIRNDIPRISKGWKKKRIVLYAHGGLVSEDSALQRISDYRRAMLDAECYPLAFIWHSDAWSTIKDVLDDATSQRRPEGFLDASKDFMLDRLDDALEPLARALGGLALWNELHPNGEPLLGMQKFIAADSELRGLFGPGGEADWVVAPNTDAEGSPTASGAKCHGGFDDDKATVLATMARILNNGKAAVTLEFAGSNQRKRAIRRKIDQMRDFSLTR